MPASSLSGYSSGIRRDAEFVPVPPSHSGAISTSLSGDIIKAPNPIGPQSPLCAGIHIISAPVAAKLTGICPAVCEASSTNTACGTSARISATGSTLPHTLEAWVTITFVAPSAALRKCSRVASSLLVSTRKQRRFVSPARHRASA